MMTEKRFRILSSYLELYTVFDDKNFEPLSSNELIDLLNGLYEENEQLKGELKSYNNMVNQYINLHIGRIFHEYINPTEVELRERSRRVGDLKQLKKEIKRV